MTDELKDEQAIWPLLMARVRALPEGDVLAFELEGCGIAIQTEFTRLRRELADTRQALDHANEELTALREYLGPENARLTNELAEAKGGNGHVSEGGTPEAMRDARLRNAIFDCVEQHPTEPKIATWYYGRALQLISDYRAELAEARAIGELEREFLNAALVEFEGIVERDATGAIVPRYQRLKKAHAALVASRPPQCADARAATGEPKEADRG